MFGDFFGSKSRRRAGGVTRRDALRIGTLAPLGLSLANVLALQAANAVGSSRARAKSVLLI